MVEVNSENIRELFNKIASRYDFMNNVISFCTHKKVRQIAIQELNINANSKVLDLCCGTGDFGNLIKDSEVIGVDFSSKMLEMARRKNSNIQYFEQDATNLNFSDKTFDYVIMGFGLRNIIDRTIAIKEINRVLKDGGYYLHLDFGRKYWINKIYNKLILFLCRFFIKNIEPYEYLVDSKKKFYSPEELIKLFEQNGLKFVKRKDLIFGIISFQIMQKCEA